jgi:hypothetical protein
MHRSFRVIVGYMYPSLAGLSGKGSVAFAAAGMELQGEP